MYKTVNQILILCHHVFGGFEVVGKPDFKDLHSQLNYHKSLVLSLSKFRCFPILVLGFTNTPPGNEQVQNIKIKVKSQIILKIWRVSFRGSHNSKGSVLKHWYIITKKFIAEFESYYFLFLVKKSFVFLFLVSFSIPHPTVASFYNLQLNLPFVIGICSSICRLRSKGELNWFGSLKKL